MKRIMVLMLMMMMVGAGIVSAQNPGAMIREINGTVELKSEGSGDWKQASVGDRIEKATMISTGFRSTALLAVGESTIVVRPLTRLTLNELLNQSGTETINIGMNSGRIRVEVKPPAGGRVDFTVQSAVATASVRGTVFEMNPVRLTVVEGLVRYSGTTGSKMAVQVNAGQNSQIDEVTSTAIHPLVLAKMDRRPQVLPGQSATVGTSVASKGIIDPLGSLGMNLILKPFTPEQE